VPNEGEFFMDTIADQDLCPLCESGLDEPITRWQDVLKLQCNVCGTVLLHESFRPNDYQSVLHVLSGWTRERTDKQGKPLTILPNNASGQTEGLTVEAILSLPSIPKSIDQQIIKLLKAVQNKSRYFGHEVNLNSARDYPLAYLEHFMDSANYRRPFSKLLQQIIDIGWLKSAVDMSSSCYELTVKGLREIEKSNQIIPDSIDCFVAMKFGDEYLDKAFKEGISSAITDAGYIPVQMAYLEHNNNIMDEMIASIRKSRFMIADLSFQNQNVYFEAGFAQGIGIPVIYTCHADHVDDIMFDTQHTNQIRWQEIDELRIKLRNRILATIF
jgi:hypothetical protein